MKVLHGLHMIRHPLRRPVVTIGAFDGVHRAHQRILKRVIQRARRLRGTSVLLTFHPHPLKVLKPDYPFFALTCIEHRLHLLSSLGLDVCIVIPFTKRFSRLSAKSFVEEILVRQLNVRELWVGFDYVFGKDREGNLSLLKAYGKRHGFKVRRIPEIKQDGKSLSSTQIRKSVAEGKLKEVSRSLGRPYSLYGRVIRGTGRGKRLGYPTANLKPFHEAIPPKGVYGVEVFFRDIFGTVPSGDKGGQFQKRPLQGYLGILNIGNRPTFGKGGRLTLEVHLLDFRGDLYGRILEIRFFKRLRPEKKFADRMALVHRIRRDEALVRQFTNEPIRWRASVPS